jgi:hypothetical protein
MGVFTYIYHFIGCIIPDDILFQLFDKLDIYYDKDNTDESYDINDSIKLLNTYLIEKKLDEFQFETIYNFKEVNTFLYLSNTFINVYELSDQKINNTNTTIKLQDSYNIQQHFKKIFDFLKIDHLPINTHIAITEN